MISEAEYKQRRERIVKYLKPNSIAILTSAKHQIRSNDTEYRFRQNSNFYYLCGFKEDNSALVFVKDKKKSKIYLFVEKKNKQKELWNGKRAGVKKARKKFEVDDVFEFKKFKKLLAKFSKNKRYIYFDAMREKADTKIYAKTLKKTPKQKDLSYKLKKMRSIKSDAEIKLIKKALSITKKAHKEARKQAKTLKYEYEIQAIFEYIFRKNGANDEAYSTIAASGDNANTLHYIKNSKKLNHKDLILIDAGCEFKYYASDITRVFPLSGKFSKPQKEIYNLVLKTQKKIISMIKAGVLRSQLQDKAIYLLTKGMVELKILKGNVKKLIKQQQYKRYYPHGIGHFIGLDVHDQNLYTNKKKKEIPLKTGMVLTIEPGLYLPKTDKTIPKKYRGIGVRIEDNILVKQDGYINLSKDIEHI